jgi:hypothetical protein
MKKAVAVVLIAMLAVIILLSGCSYGAKMIQDGNTSGGWRRSLMAGRVNFAAPDLVVKVVLVPENAIELKVIEAPPIQDGKPAEIHPAAEVSGDENQLPRQHRPEITIRKTDRWSTILVKPKSRGV